MQAEFFIEELKSNHSKRTLETGRFYGVLWIMRGSCLVTYETESRRRRQEEILLVKPWQKITLQTESLGQETQLIWLLMSDQLLQRLSDKEIDFAKSFAELPYHCFAVYASSSDSALTKNMAKRLLLRTTETSYGNQVFMRSLITLQLVIILRLCMEHPAELTTGKRRKFMLDDIFVFIRDHLSEKITLMRLEEEFFISHEHIAREFRKQTGQTVHHYILKLRLEKSCHCLQNGDSISDTWQLCGFNSYSYFHQAFRRHYGMTPSTYAKRSAI